MKVTLWKWKRSNKQVKFLIYFTWEKCLWNFFCLALLVVVGEDVDEDLLTFPGACTTPPAAIDGALLLSGFERWLKEYEIWKFKLVKLYSRAGKWKKNIKKKNLRNIHQE